jgi:hypothetical protein
MKGGRLTMEKTESGVLIEHIEEAKDWLDKAKDEYSQANNLRGEMILNLAQAEVKHAWELSRHHFVSNNITAFDKKKTYPLFRNGYILPAAASIIILLGVIISARMVKINNDSRILANLPTPSSIKIETAKAEQKGPLVKQEAVEPSKTVSRVEPVKPLVQQGSEIKKSTPVTAVAANLTNSTAVEEVGQRDRQELKTNTTSSRLQSVSVLSIDEDALTKEASHSLRSGK